MTLEELGYGGILEDYRIQQGLDSFEVGRVILEHKDRYVLLSPEGEFEAELMGNLRFTAESRRDLPAVGDWVAFMKYDEDKALIQAVYPRHSLIERKAAGKAGQAQIIAANIDFGLIVQAVDRDFNLNRLERYLALCHSGGIAPVIVLSKTDLISEQELEKNITQIRGRHNDVRVVPASDRSIGYSQVAALVEAGKTYCLLGSSGAGKSTLLNALAGREEMKTGEISTAVNKGRHTTSHRELIVLDSGGILIDNPGMREVGMTDSAQGLETTFESILSHADGCRYKDCTHMHEEGCAVIEAVESGDIDHDAYLNYQKMEKERQHFESDALERKQKDKDLARIIKDMKKKTGFKGT